MSLFLTDPQIQSLLGEAKPLPANWRSRMKLKPKRGHKERELDIQGADGSKFRIILRQADLNPLDFSVILSLLCAQTNEVFRLRRHNGKSHEHTNKIEVQTFYDFHIHQATERDVSAGHPEDGFAEVTDKYSDFEGALNAMIADTGFVLPSGPMPPPMPLFDGVEP